MARLLVIDDDEDVLWIIQDMLRFKGYRVVAVTDGEEALKIIDKEDFDLVLTDLGMPRISGWDIAKKAKAKNPKLPVVLLTGWGTSLYWLMIFSMLRNMKSVPPPGA